MKKLNYFLLGAAALALASCSQDDMLNNQPPGDGNFNVTVKLPDDLATRAVDMNTGLTAEDLYFAVYDASDGSLIDKGQTTFGTNLQTVVSFNLANAKSYKISFFASAPGNNVYKFDATNKVMTVDYTQMTSAGTEDNDLYDCFINLLETGVIGSGTVNSSITLYRPIAQINWGTSDLGLPAVEAAFGTNGEYLQSTLTTMAYNTFSLLDNDVVISENPDLSITDKSYISNVALKLFAQPKNGADQVAGFPVNGYEYVTMQYLLAPKNPTTYDLNLAITNNGNTTGAEIVTHDVEVNNAPVQANFRTNIYGNLLTDNVNITVVKDPYWNIPDYDIENGAIVEFVNGKVNCKTPALPAGVNPEDFADNNNAGAVAIGADGQPVFFAATGSAISTAMQTYSEIYFAPNVTIETTSHALVVPQSGITIHGNGATFQGGERDFSIQSTYETGSVVNINISNLNNFKVWGSNTDDVTFNINLTNCTLNGNGLTDSSSMIMTRSSDSSPAIVNLSVNNCLVQNTQVAMHSSHVGTIVVNNCIFNNVGIPINYAKKLTNEDATVTVSNCIFNTCGILPTDTDNTAYDYAAPVRVVDNGGPSYSVSVLVENCTFKDTQSKWDILLWDYRDGKTSYPVKLSVLNCTPADPSVETITQPVNPIPSN